MKKDEHSSLLQLIKFAIVGGTVSLTYAVCCSLTVAAGILSPFAASVIFYALMIPVAFWLHHKFSFANVLPSGGLKPLLLYAATQMIAAILVASAISGFATANPVFNLLLFLVISAASAIITFLVCKFFVFKISQPDIGAR